MDAQISEKSTKAEILKAYETLLKDVQQAKSDVPKSAAEEKLRKETLAKVSDATSAGIAKNIAEFKSSLNISLDDMQQKLTAEFQKFENIRAAITVEKKSLEDLYSLSANTDSLAAMLLVNKEKKGKF